MTTPSRDLEGTTFCSTKAGLLEGTNAACIKTTNIANYAINGYGYTKAITDNIAMTALAVQADLTTCLYGIDIDSAGTVSMVKGVAVTSTDLVAPGAANLKLPAKQTDKCRLGLMRIVMSGGTFTCGTTDLSGTGVTATFFDFVGGGPVQPRTS